MTRVQLAGLAAVAVFAAQAAAASAAQDPRRVEAGRRLAGTVCSACHQVAPDQPTAPLLDQPTPSFAQIAARPGVSSASLRGFIKNTHWDQKTTPITMPNPMLTPGQIDEVASYILSLRKPGRRAGSVH